MPDEERDRELIARVADGDRSALTELVASHRAAAWRVVRLRTRDDATAEDALQETFLGVWRGAAGFRGETAVRTWILGLARRQAARTWRRHVGEPVRHEPLAALGAAAGWGGDDPELAASRAEDATRVHAALDRLAPDDSDVIVLHDLEGLSGPETAEALGLSLAAMKSRLHRARLRLMGALREEVTA